MEEGNINELHLFKEIFFYLRNDFKTLVSIRKCNKFFYKSIELLYYRGLALFVQSEEYLELICKKAEIKKQNILISYFDRQFDEKEDNFFLIYILSMNQEINIKFMTNFQREKVENCFVLIFRKIEKKDFHPLCFEKYKSSFISNCFANKIFSELQYNQLIKENYYPSFSEKEFDEFVCPTVDPW